MAVRNIKGTIQGVDINESLYTEVNFIGPQDISVNCRFYRKNELVFIWVDEIQTLGLIASEFVSKDEIDSRFYPQDGTRPVNVVTVSNNGVTGAGLLYIGFDHKIHISGTMWIGGVFHTISPGIVGMVNGGTLSYIA